MDVRAGRRLQAAGIVAWLMVCCAAAFDAWQWWQAVRLNAAIDDGSLVSWRGDLPPRGNFAAAWHLARRGEIQRALGAYKRAERDPELAAAARYNAANLYLRAAIGAEDDPAARLPYLELAKQAYREALRADPELWPARYNLERTLRLAPDPEDVDSSEGPQPLHSERAVTTARAVTLGLP